MYLLVTFKFELWAWNSPQAQTCITVTSLARPSSLLQRSVTKGCSMCLVSFPSSHKPYITSGLGSLSQACACPGSSPKSLGKRPAPLHVPWSLVVFAVQLLTPVQLFATPRDCSEVCYAIHPSYTLSSSSPPAFNVSQHHGPFQWLGSLDQMAKVLELQHGSSQRIFRTDFL